MNLLEFPYTHIFFPGKFEKNTFITSNIFKRTKFNYLLASKIDDITAFFKIFKITTTTKHLLVYLKTSYIELLIDLLAQHKWKYYL